MKNDSNFYKLTDLCLDYIKITFLVQKVVLFYIIIVIRITVSSFRYNMRDTSAPPIKQDTPPSNTPPQQYFLQIQF